jgi:hypothetical protein|nr:MAG TPA: hypothetical protein [Caudoviricetes sp.]
MDTMRLFALDIFDGEGAEGAEGGQTGAEQQSDENGRRRAEFDEYIKANKDLYGERFERELGRRMKGVTGERDRLKGDNERYARMAETLTLKYGTAAGDMDALEAAINNDKAALEEQAAEAGLTPEQLMNMRRLEAENSRFKAAAEAQEREAERERVLQKWNEEAEAIKAVYDGFDLETEAQNPDFTQLLGAGVPMKLAYETIHHDEIVGGSMQYAVQRTEKRVIDSVRANGLRAVEGAGANTAAATYTTDINKLTKQQCEDMERRAMRGERITLA